MENLNKLINEYYNSLLQTRTDKEYLTKEFVKHCKIVDDYLSEINMKVIENNNRNEKK